MGIALRPTSRARRLAFVLGIASAVFLGQGRAWACQCVERLPPAREAATRENGVVVEGFVTRGTDRESLRDARPSRLVVSRAWLGASPGDKLEIQTVAGSCTVFLDEGKSYLVYAGRTSKGSLEANACTVMTSEAARAAFGAEMGPPPEPPRGGCGACRMPGAGVGAGDAISTAIVLAVLSLLLLRRTTRAIEHG